jgi:hypothetical protein
MAKIGKIRASVAVNHKTAREYRLPANDQNASTNPNLSIGYIEAKPGVEFRFNIKLQNNFMWDTADVVVVDAYINGKIACGVLLPRSDRQPNGTWHADLDGVYKVTNEGEDCKHLKWTFEEVDTSKTFLALFEP